MKVKELIELLQTMPQESEVIYSCYSDYTVLDADTIKVQKSTDSLTYGCPIPHHNMPGEFRRYVGPHEYGNLPLPTPANVVILPGN